MLDPDNGVPMANNKFHYFLVSGEVIFTHPDSDGIASMRLNTFLKLNSKVVSTRNIAKAQQVLQVRMFERIQDEKAEVMDVYIAGISYLGHMTEEEWAKPPEGMQVQERAAAPAQTLEDVLATAKEI